MRGRLAMTLGLVLVGAWGLAWCGVREPRRAIEGGRDRLGAAAEAPEVVTAPLGRSALDALAARTPSEEPTWIRGRVRMSDGDACRSGWVFAWRVGFVPSAADFAGERLRAGTSRIHAAPIRADGSFELEGLAPEGRFTLGAAAPGSALAERPSLVAPGREGVELRLRYLLGLAILLEDARGGPLRTSPGFFGRGPSASGPGTKLLENPPELAALPVTGLEPGHGTRDRWQYLALSETRALELRPIEYGVHVPGYAPTDVKLQARPVLDRLEEVRVRLEPVAEDWGALDVTLVGAAHVRDFGLPEDELVGVVRLVRAGDEPWEARTVGFAVHARSLSAPEVIGSLPAGDYEAIFAAEDSTYETAPVRLGLTPGRHSLVFDVADSGLLWVDLRDGTASHDGRCALRIELGSGGHFYATFDRSPYVVPFLSPGPHRLSEVDAPGCAALKDPGLPFEIYAGQATIEIVACEPAVDAAGARSPR